MRLWGKFLLWKPSKLDWKDINSVTRVCHTVLNWIKDQRQPYKPVKLSRTEMCELPGPEASLWGFRQLLCTLRLNHRIHVGLHCTEEEEEPSVGVGSSDSLHHQKMRMCRTGGWRAFSRPVNVQAFGRLRFRSRIITVKHFVHRCAGFCGLMLCAASRSEKRQENIPGDVSPLWDGNFGHKFAEREKSV